MIPKKKPVQFLQDACEVPKDDDIKLAIKSLKLLGALTTERKQYDRRSYHMKTKKCDCQKSIILSREHAISHTVRATKKSLC